MSMPDAFGLLLPSPLGELLLTSNGKAITGLWMQGQSRFPTALPERWEPLPVFSQAEAWLERYFSGCNPGTVPPLQPTGTPFQLRVWAALARIPYGTTVTYATLAASLTPPSSPRAVGSAVGRNPISILLPCHRVVGSDGTLTGYAGGVARKALLLSLEQNHVSPGKLGESAVCLPQQSSDQ